MQRLDPPKNPNYCAIVVSLSTFVDLPNCDNVKSALIFGNSVIVGKNNNVGEVGLYFPVETQLSKDFISANNLFRKPEWGNVDPLQKGFFEEHGRVKAVKFRGHKSEGFWIPISSLAYLNATDVQVGSEFDSIDGHLICKKYEVVRNVPRGSNKVAKQPRNEDKIVEGQFRFHPDTENLRRNVHKLSPDMWVSISEKWHGTSVVIGRLLVKRVLKWYEKIARKLGVKVQDQEYGLTWSSRRVVKGVNGETKELNNHFYSEDIWGIVAKAVEPFLYKGMTIYGEIVGYTTEGSAIQKGYHYGCRPKQYRFLVYRITMTNLDGKVIEFSWNQVKEFCDRNALEMVKEIWFGRLGDWGLSSSDHWHQELLSMLEHLYIKEEMCPHNNLEVPVEGIVLKVDSLDEDIAYKLKNFKFLEWETKSLDKGEADIESDSSEAA